MAEKTNCSPTKVSDSLTKRRLALPSLSRILKSQSSSFKHRSSPSIIRKSSGGLTVFVIKALVGCSAVYLSTLIGVWGEAEESTKIMKKITKAISEFNKETIYKDVMNNDLVEKISMSTDFLKSQLEGIPEELKAFYDKSEKYFNDLIKGKKS